MPLLDRTGKERDDGVGLNSMVVLSALLHALVLSIALFSPSLPTQTRSFIPSYTVDLVTLPATAAEVRFDRVPALDDISVDARDTSVISRRTIETARTAPIERIQVQRRDEPAEVDDAIRRIEERLAAARGSAPSERAGLERAAPGPEPVSDDRMNPYYSALWLRIKEQWALPEAILAGRQLEAVLAVTIRRDGSMDRLVFEQRSGNVVFDESAESAVRKAAPFPPLPGWLRDASIDVGIRFRSSDYH